jgi:hypothetical protein
MTIKSLITRRQFIAGISSAGVLPFLPPRQTLFLPDKKDNYLNFLVAVLKEQALYVDAKFQRGEEENLRYAYEQINPQNHQELAFIVACGSHVKPLAHIVDEYVRRRKGEESLLPDAEMAPAIVTGVPDTQRILIFKEQLISLVDELTSLDGAYNQMIFEKILNKEETLDIFIAESLLPIYRDHFERDYVKSLYDAILYYGPICRSYVWCSTVANRAGEMIVQARQ